MYPIIILVRPQLPENIGLISRIMSNFNFKELRIVNPRDGCWPNKRVISSSAGAKEFVKKIKVYNKLDDATENIHILISLTARKREINIKEKTIFNVVKEYSNNHLLQEKIGILLGPENSGLSNKDIINSNYIITLPTGENYKSLNISHAVTIICWEFFKELNKNKFNMKDISDEKLKSEKATLKEKNFFLKNTEKMLDKSNYFNSTKMKEKIMSKIKIIFNKSSLTKKEINTLHGMLKSLYNFNKHT